MKIDQEQIMKAAKKAGFYKPRNENHIYTAALEHLPITKYIEKLYRIAYLDGKKSMGFTREPKSPKKVACVGESNISIYKGTFSDDKSFTVSNDEQRD